MKLSVLINNFNYARYLRQCIDSALEQDHPDFEVIVVDDGSTDESRKIIASYGSDIVPVLKPNGGQASCFNAGFAASYGEVAFFLDADDAFLPGKLSRVAEIYENLSVDWCYDRVTNLPDAVPSAVFAVTPVDRRSETRRGIFPSVPVPTSGLSFRRELLAQILPMPVAADIVLSDNYLKFAAAGLGQGAIIQTPLTFQRIHDSNRYTGAASRGAIRPRIMVETGIHLARRYADMSKLGLRLVAGGLAERDLPLASVLGEIQRFTADGPFGRFGAVEIAARVLLRRSGIARSRAPQ